MITGTFCFMTWDVPAAHEFQCQSGFIIACTILSLMHNEPQSHLWLPDPDSEPRISNLWDEYDTIVPAKLCVKFHARNRSDSLNFFLLT